MNKIRVVVGTVLFLASMTTGGTTAGQLRYQVRKRQGQIDRVYR